MTCHFMEEPMTYFIRDAMTFYRGTNDIPFHGGANDMSFYGGTNDIFY